MKNKSDVLQRAVRAAGEVVRKARPNTHVIEKEGRTNIVTGADIASEKVIIEMIRKNFPHDKILSEETVSDIRNPLEIDALWVIDPLDGTNNFRYQRNYSAISIGYVEKGVIQLGAAYDPYRDELFYARRGKGSFLNGKIIRTGNLKDLSKATIATDNFYHPEDTRHNLELFLKLNPTPWILVKGCAVLTMCDVAAGRIDLYFHNFLKPWDNAAAFLIAEEAGATVKGIHGEDITFLSENAVIGNKNLVGQFLQTIIMHQ